MSEWLHRFTPEQWIQASLGELRQAETAFQANNVRGGIAGCKRAAGMALNAALIAEPNDAWGRTYVEHVEALAKDASAPEAVRAACKALLEAQPPATSGVVALRTPSSDARVLEAARDVMAHAYAVVKRNER